MLCDVKNHGCIVVMTPKWIKEFYILIEVMSIYCMYFKNIMY